MSRAFRATPLLLLAFALGGCSAGDTGDTGGTATTATPRPSTAVVAAAGSSDVGNDRPQVTYDGLMVRRRVVIAIQPTPGADLVSLRRAMDKAAAQRHTTLFGISANVLDPAVLEKLVPEVTVVLPAGATVADARALIDPVSAPGGTFRRFPELEDYEVTSVLVHDLRFTVRSARPAFLAQAIALEGILSDALGSYTTTFGRGELVITYTGPLLSDDLVESVRGGIARRAGTRSAAVTVSPRSSTGVGVDMAKEPAPAPAFPDESSVPDESSTHNHSAGPP